MVDEVPGAAPGERRRLIGVDHFGGLVALILATIVLTPILSDWELGGAIAGFLSALVLVAAYVAAGARPRVLYVVSAVAALAALVSITGTVATDSSEIPSGILALIAAMLVASPFVVLRRILSHEHVTLATVAGALAAYLLVGVAFSAIYLLIDSVDADAFSTPLAGASTYFSFVTLTTLGYGDITAVSDVARSFVIVEAVMGQVLLVTLVARFVSTLGQTRSEAPRGGPRTG